VGTAPLARLENIPRSTYFHYHVRALNSSQTL